MMVLSHPHEDGIAALDALADALNAPPVPANVAVLARPTLPTFCLNVNFEFMKQADRYMEKVTGAWKSLYRITFEQAGLEAAFNHVRNLVISTLIIAAGVHATVHGPSMPALAVFELEWSGYAVAASGLTLAILNLLDGLHKLARTNTPNLLRVLVIIFYLLFSVRIAQLIFLFRIS